jgi:hypothetical protein
MAEQMPELMPQLMDNLMPHLVDDLVPLVSDPMIAYLKRSAQCRRVVRDWPAGGNCAGGLVFMYRGGYGRRGRLY